MIRQAVLGATPAPALRRLAALAPLDVSSRMALETAIAQSRFVRAGSELAGEGQEMAGPSLIVGGWAARVRLLPDGRRQLISFLLPGDLIGSYRQPNPVSLSKVTAVSRVSVCAAPDPESLHSLARAYAISGAIEEACLLAQIVRLGRMTAQERIFDLLLELLERLRVAGLVTHDEFDIPLTQEMLADALGLTAIHVNRMIQLARRSGDLRWAGGRLRLADPAALSVRIGRKQASVTTL